MKNTILEVKFNSKFGSLFDSRDVTKLIGFTHIHNNVDTHKELLEFFAQFMRDDSVELFVQQYLESKKANAVDASSIGDAFDDKPVEEVAQEVVKSVKSKRTVKGV